MARRCVGYEGEGRTRPLYVDEGPARGRVGGALDSDPLTRLSAMTIPSRLMADGLSGGESGASAPIERRQITDLERAVRREREVGRSPELVAPPSRPATVTPVPQEIIPMSVTPPTTSVSRPGLTLPCASCLHAEVCSIRPLLEAERPSEPIVTEIRPGVRVFDLGIRERVECDHYLAATESPPRAVGRHLPAPTGNGASPEASRRRGTEAMLAARGIRDATGAMPPYIRRMIDALVATDGDREAAAKALGVKPTSLAGSLNRIRARTDLTPVERAAVAVKARVPEGRP